MSDFSPKCGKPILTPTGEVIGTLVHCSACPLPCLLDDLKSRDNIPGSDKRTDSLADLLFDLG